LETTEDQLQRVSEKAKDALLLHPMCKEIPSSLYDPTHTLSKQELLTRSSLETQKLQLLTEISTLRLKQVSLERENVELKERYQSGKSMGDLTYADSSGTHRIWDKPPLVPLNGAMRSSSPSHQNLMQQDPRLRLGSNGSEHGQQSQSQQQQQVMPPNRVRVRYSQNFVYKFFCKLANLV
jgi:hypothetical protein